MTKSIETFNDLYDAILYLETEAEGPHEFFDSQLYRTPDGRWRVGIITQPQLDMFDGFLE